MAFFERAVDVMCAPYYFFRLPFKTIRKIDRERRATDRLGNARAGTAFDLIRNVALAAIIVPPSWLLSLLLVPLAFIAAVITALVILVLFAGMGSAMD